MTEGQLHWFKDVNKNGDYTTHSTEFLDLNDYENVNVVRKTPRRGTYICQGKEIDIEPTSREKLKLMTEFDNRRNELFFAEKIMIVEGDTEKIVMPFLFSLKGIYINKESISIINAGSITNMKFFIKITRNFKIPFVVLMDKHSNKPNYDTYYIPLNDGIVSAAGNSLLVYMIDPEFEVVFGLPDSGDKIRNAVEKVKKMDAEGIPRIVDDAINGLLRLK